MSPDRARQGQCQSWRCRQAGQDRTGSAGLCRSTATHQQSVSTRQVPGPGLGMTTVHSVQEPPPSKSSPQAQSPSNPALCEQCCHCGSRSSEEETAQWPGWQGKGSRDIRLKLNEALR